MSKLTDWYTGCPFTKRLLPVPMPTVMRASGVGPSCAPSGTKACNKRMI